jgi:hypothetical protein
LYRIVRMMHIVDCQFDSLMIEYSGLDDSNQHYYLEPLLVI